LAVAGVPGWHACARPVTIGIHRGTRPSMDARDVERSLEVKSVS
jgi:hypothetical protein